MAAVSAHIHAYLEFLITNTLHNILSKLLAALSYNHIQNNVSNKRDMNSVSMTYHQFLERKWQSKGLNQLPPVLKSCLLQIKLQGLACHY